MVKDRKTKLSNKERIFGVIIVIFWIVVFFVCSEILIRVILFSHIFNIGPLKQCTIYADPYSDNDFWKLHYRVNGLKDSLSPRRIHSLLGWSQADISTTNPLGLKSDEVAFMQSKKTVVLFYGDSFVRGSSDKDYEIPVYMRRELPCVSISDLSVGGYGLDQIFLMFNLTYKKAEKPFVVIGVLVSDDLDRVILSVRTAQKPYFAVEKDSLVLRGVPIKQDPATFFRTHPPLIKSYFWRLLLKIMRRIFPEAHNGPSRIINEKIAINSMIIERIQTFCKSENYPLLFVLFYDLRDLTRLSWQESFIKSKLSDLGISYVDAKLLLLNYANKHRRDLKDFYIGDISGHHNNLGNQVIADGIINNLLDGNFKNKFLCN